MSLILFVPTIILPVIHARSVLTVLHHPLSTAVAVLGAAVILNNRLTLLAQLLVSTFLPHNSDYSSFCRTLAIMDNHDFYDVF